MNVLVIGGQGFIGHNLVLKLLKEKHNVYIFDRSIKKDRYINSCKYIVGEFNQINELKHILNEIDVVYHMISTTVPNNSNSNIEYDINSNVINSVKLIEMCCKKNIKKIIFPSSGGTVYGISKEVPIKEEFEQNPITSYGINKLTIEKYLYMFNYQYGLDYKILRIANPYGPHQNHLSSQGVVGIFLYKILKNENIQIYGDGNVIRDYIYIEDVIDALYSAAIKDTKSRIFNIGSGKGTSLNELIDIIKGEVRRTVKIDYKEARNIDVPANVLDINKAYSELNWYPKFDMHSGIRNTWNWFIENYKYMIVQ